MLTYKIPLLAGLIAVAACLPYPETDFQPEGKAVSVTGVIDDTTLGGLKSVLRVNPTVKTLVLQNVPGSADDEASLSELSRFIRGKGLTTRVPADGMVASGGTDMVVMGATRIIEPGACIGVHSWAAGGFLGEEIGSELPKNDPTHQLYLRFYKEMGIAEEFYWFTLAVAGPDDIHWMSPGEINRYRLATVPVAPYGKETRQQRKQRCDARL